MADYSPDMQTLLNMLAEQATKDGITLPLAQPARPARTFPEEPCVAGTLVRFYTQGQWYAAIRGGRSARGDAGSGKTWTTTHDSVSGRTKLPERLRGRATWADVCAWSEGDSLTIFPNLINPDNEECN